MTLGQAQQLKVGDKLELAGKTWTVEALTWGGCTLKDSEGAACYLSHLEIAALGIEQQRGGDAETIDHYRRAGNWLSHQWAQEVGHAVPGLEDAWKATEEQP